MGLLKSLFRNSEASGEPGTPQVGEEHYVLQCMACDFTHAIPLTFSDGVLDYSVDARRVRIVCVYGGRFTVTLGVKDFFTITKAAATGLVLKASIADNMHVLHDHLMSHCDPLFLSIKQSPTTTEHEYRTAPKGNTYVRFSATDGTDIVGEIDVSKAEIPGIS